MPSLSGEGRLLQESAAGSRRRLRAYLSSDIRAITSSCIALSRLCSRNCMAS
jgi:hypothetical protein